MSRWFVTLLLCAACSGKDTDTDTTGGLVDTGDTGCDTSVDADCDGWPDDEDCEPNQPYSYPGASEIPYDGHDNDCAGDGDLTDVDGDGYDGESAGGDDCNDGNPDIYPGAEEVCYDGLAQDCNLEDDTGWSDEDCDGDGHIGQGSDATDCDDTDAAINPDAEEIWYDGVDQDCSYTSDYDQDEDGDDIEDTAAGTDCDDTDPVTSGQAPELWDGLDRDCDGDATTLQTLDASLAFEPNSSTGDWMYGWNVLPLDDYDGDGVGDLGITGPASGVYYDGWFTVMPGGGPDGLPKYGAMARVMGAEGEVDTGGGYPGDVLGWDADELGDLDGDGWTEVVLGAPYYPVGSDYGAALVFDGAGLASAAAESFGADTGDFGVVESSDAWVVATGASYLGVDVANAGDVDGDGHDDLAAGTGSWADSWVGVWSGSLIAEGIDVDAVTMLASIEGTKTGGETVGGADYDGDGMEDLVLGGNTLDSDGYLAKGATIIIPGSDLVDGAVLATADYS
ncbi:MAG: MopE-related protein, partial [Myxococcota bacterium]|nr:MopE-related protein [Myxococcota bacterium]